MDTKRILDWINNNWMPLLLLLIVITLSVQIRLYNQQDSLSGMDPYFYAQWTERIIENDMQLPFWNEFSHYPPGRPTIDMWPLWSYIEAVSYLTFGQGMEFLQFIHYMPAYFVVFVVLSAFLLGRKVSKSNYGGVISSYFVSFSIMFFNRSANGFADSDGLVFALTFLTAYTTLRAIENPKILNYGLAIFSYFLFTQAWSQPYWVFVVFVASVPVLFVLRYIESYRNSQEFDWKEFKSIALVLLVVVSVSSGVALFFNGNHIINSLSVAMQFMGGEDLIVNRSIAELQAHGEFWASVLQNIGPLIYVALFGFAALFIHDFYYNKKISFTMVFLLVWFFGTLYLSSIGSRYILMLTMSMTASMAFVIIQGYRRIPERFSKNIYIISLLAGLLIFYAASHVSEMQNYAIGTSNYGLSQNWIDALEHMQSIVPDRTVCYQATVINPLFVLFTVIFILSALVILNEFSNDKLWGLFKNGKEK